MDGNSKAAGTSAAPLVLQCSPHHAPSFPGAGKGGKKSTPNPALLATPSTTGAHAGSAAAAGSSGGWNSFLTSKAAAPVITPSHAGQHENGCSISRLDTGHQPTLTDLHNLVARLLTGTHGRHVESAHKGSGGMGDEWIEIRNAEKVARVTICVLSNVDRGLVKACGKGGNCFGGVVVAYC